MTGKQRAYLRGLANGLDTIVHIGKGGVTEAVVRQTDEALAARELVKCRVLETAMLTAREAGDILARETGAEGVQVIGSRFVLYRPDPESPKITLPKA
jgi:RNA-binding protein